MEGVKFVLICKKLVFNEYRTISKDIPDWHGQGD